MIFSRRMMVAAALVMLAGCQSDAKPDAAAAQADPEMDRCGASQYQQYVGKPLSSISSLKFGHAVRAIPHNSAVTMDFNLNRLNFLGDEKNNITKVYCG
ncbi:I78 family peptidase inhibitor [Erwinia sp. 9145]|uniref:I78 family peptidase inhibitor n=1 Tax=Erwinia sp. 9145 TaxID=1500895 RepID=UPI00054FC3FE|nr:I78 family peptidase inhibitor [Erwinia sp. 9145]